jgi:antitoxin MazE
MEMKTSVQKWGNSLAIRIPSAFALETELTNGAEVDLQLKSGTLVIRPQRKKRYQLSHLLSQVRKTNRHSEVIWGESTGKEIW